MPDTKALKELLPEIEKQEGQWPDDLLGKFLCAVHGWKYIKTVANGYSIVVVGDEFKSFRALRDRCPDTDLTAADKLCGELGYRRRSGPDGACTIYYKLPLKSQVTKAHAATEPTAILLALARALIAEGEE